MSSRIDNNAGAVQRQVYSYQRRKNSRAALKKASPKVKLKVSEGVKSAAKAALGGTTDLKRISESRKLSRPVDELTGIMDLDARYYVHKGADRQVVQLREAKTSKLVRQVPDQATLDRLTSMRRFVGKILDFIG